MTAHATVGDGLSRYGPAIGQRARTTHVVRASRYVTPVKTRILAGGVHSAKQQVVRIDREKRHPLFHEWRKEVKGVSVSVWRRPGRTKELILEVHFAVFGIDRLPNTDRWNEVLSRAIRSAMAAGWDPESRGSARRHTPV